MKNDVIVALLGFVLSAMVAWLGSLTVMVFNLDKAHAVREVVDGQVKEKLDEHVKEFEEFKAL